MHNPYTETLDYTRTRSEPNRSSFSLVTPHEILSQGGDRHAILIYVVLSSLQPSTGLAGDLTSLSSQLLDFVIEAAKKENMTLAANETIHARVDHALKTATRAADKSVTLKDLQAQLTPTLQPLISNASAVRLLGHQSVVIVTTWMLNGSEVYNDSKALLDMTSLPNPDRSQVSGLWLMFLVALHPWPPSFSNFFLLLA